jgi:hypothetical protein
MAAKTPRKKTELPEVVINEQWALRNFEEVRYNQRGMDKFTINRNDGSTLEVLGHEIAMSKAESERVNHPVYQIIQYIPMTFEAQPTRQVIKGELLNDQNAVVKVGEITEEHTEYVQVVMWIGWPGTYTDVVRELGE